MSAGLAGLRVRVSFFHTVRKYPLGLELYPRPYPRAHIQTRIHAHRVWYPRVRGYFVPVAIFRCRGGGRREVGGGADGRAQGVREREREREGELDRRAGPRNGPCGRGKKEKRGERAQQEVGASARKGKETERGGRKMGRAVRERKEKERPGWIVAKLVRGL
jgi:hypothetical protein